MYVLVDILDVGFSVFNIDFIVLINLDDLEKIVIIGLGSCVCYVGFFVGDVGDIENFNIWLLF